MTYLITQIILCLIAAALLGLFTGWLLWRRRGGEDTHAFGAQREIDRKRIRTLEAQLAERDAAPVPTRPTPEPLAAPVPHPVALDPVSPEAVSPEAVSPEAVSPEAEPPAETHVQAAPLAPEVYQTTAPVSDLSSVPYEDDFAIDDPFADEFSDDDIAPGAFEETGDGPSEATFSDDTPLAPSPLPIAPEAERPTSPTYDDLKRISGIGPAIESRLAEIGITTYRQIAHFTDEDIERVGAHIDFFADRIRREGWVVQAAALHRQTYGTKP